MTHHSTVVLPGNPNMSQYNIFLICGNKIHCPCTRCFTLFLFSVISVALLLLLLLFLLFYCIVGEEYEKKKHENNYYFAPPQNTRM
jgi:hypothetical protein